MGRLQSSLRILIQKDAAALAVHAEEISGKLFRFLCRILPNGLMDFFQPETEFADSLFSRLRREPSPEHFTGFQFAQLLIPSG